MTNSRFNIFSETDIPYSVLEKFGLTPEMVDDLPQNVMQRLLSGRETPVLPIKVKDSEDKEQTSLSRICLYRNSDGTVDVNFIPMWKDKELTEYDEEQQGLLLQGDVIIVNIPGRGDCYVQYDDAIRQTLTVPVSLIAHNVETIARNCECGEDDLQGLLQGKIVERQYDDNTISIGIDLNDITGCRICNGDALAWKEEKKGVDLPQYNFGICGCWVNDQINNAMHYVPEEQYTEDMLNEMKLVGQQRAAYAQMGSLHV